MSIYLLLFFVTLVFGNFLNLTKPFRISIRISDCIYLFFIYWAFVNNYSLVVSVGLVFFAKLISILYRSYLKQNLKDWFINFVFEFLPLFFMVFFIYFFSFSKIFENLFGNNILFLEVMVYFVFLYLLYIIIFYVLNILFNFKVYFEQYYSFFYEDFTAWVIGLIFNIALFLIFYDLSQKNLFLVYLMIIGLLPIYFTNYNYDWLFKATEDTIEKVAGIIEAKNVYAKGHSQRVAELCEKFGKFLGLSYEEINKLSHSAKIMNLGYISIPEYIFGKATNLTLTEWRYIKEHPIVAYNVLKKLDFYKDVANIIKYIHENWDGSGYPEGKKGNETPFLSRVIKICDVFLALTEERAYRNAYTFHEAIEIIKKEREKFDPEILEKFLEFIQKEYAEDFSNIKFGDRLQK